MSRSARTSPSAKRTQKRASAPPDATVGDDQPREPRGARRRRETREKLIEAAFSLMAERGLDAVTINEITEAADVGIGSFYNHFESREALQAAVIDTVFEEFADHLDRLVVAIDDPAEVIAISVRHTVLRAQHEPLWGQFLVKEGLSTRALTRGLGARLARDIQRGIAKRRFSTPDPTMSLITLGAGVLGAIAAVLETQKPDSMLQSLGLDRGSVAERAAAMLLHGLGLSFDQADVIARLPLPEI
ncbi:TetR/AcrR family transcriptional regulator [Hydrocarboniphaga effusa]|jgi:AcrR family transcriptional regulator|uniref:TetR/AcrR family transcriptional regulator n=1 Tax=Hydrocarboniphaga effusa TaxID=243629 RepID=UPI0031376D8C